MQFLSFCSSIEEEEEKGCLSVTLNHSQFQDCDVYVPSLSLGVRHLQPGSQTSQLRSESLASLQLHSKDARLLTFETFNACSSSRNRPHSVTFSKDNYDPHERSPLNVHVHQLLILYIFLSLIAVVNESVHMHLYPKNPGFVSKICLLKHMKKLIFMWFRSQS